MKNQIKTEAKEMVLEKLESLWQEFDTLACEGSDAKTREEALIATRIVEELERTVLTT